MENIRRLLLLVWRGDWTQAWDVIHAHNVHINGYSLQWLSLFAHLPRNVLCVPVLLRYWTHTLLHVKDELYFV